MVLRLILSLKSTKILDFPIKHMLCEQFGTWAGQISGATHWSPATERVQVFIVFYDEYALDVSFVQQKRKKQKSMKPSKEALKGNTLPQFKETPGILKHFTRTR